MTKRILFLFCLLFFVPARAADVVEGYARTSYQELFQTVVMLGGLDITSPNVADEYARVVYCDLYQKNYANDIAWDRIRKDIIGRVQGKQEDYRLNYEVTSRFALGRYDFQQRVFPLTDDTKMKQVGSLILNDKQGTSCGLTKGGPFPTRIVLYLRRPLTVDSLAVSVDDVDKIMARMLEAKNVTRSIYGRVRVHVTGIPDTQSLGKLQLRGDVTSVDFFLDPEMTKPIAGMQYGVGD